MAKYWQRWCSLFNHFVIEGHPQTKDEANKYLDWRGRRRGGLPVSPATCPCSREEGLLEALIKRSQVSTSLEIIDILSSKWASINL